MSARLVKLVGSALLFAWDAFCKFLLRILGRPSPGTCVVLYYHAIKDDQKERFAAQMDRLLRFTKPISAGSRTPLEPGRHYSAVTFDDGFVSVIRNALPVLESRRIPATMFVPTGSLGGPPLWVNDAQAPARRETVLSARELKAFNGASTLAIGSHSVNHPDFLKLDSTRAQTEFVESKATLEKILGSEVPLFSFPHGACNPALIKQARDAGYQRVFTISPQSAFARPDEFVTGRVLVDPSDWPSEFTLKLLGAYRWLPAVSALKACLVHRSN